MQIDLTTLPPVLGGEDTAKTIDMRNLRKALYLSGLIDKVDEIAQTNAEFAIDWEYATTIVRHDPLIQVITQHVPDAAVVINELF